MSLISRPVLAPAFSGASVTLDRPARYGDGPVVVTPRSKRQAVPDPDPADVPATRADIVRLEGQLEAILEAVVVLRDRFDS